MNYLNETEPLKYCSLAEHLLCFRDTVSLCDFTPENYAPRINQAEA